MSVTIPELIEAASVELDDIIMIVSSTDMRYKRTTVGELISSYVPTKASMGLDLVDNTRDIDKPISVATLKALECKSNVGHTHPVSEIADLEDQLKDLVQRVTEMEEKTDMTLINSTLVAQTNKMVKSALLNYSPAAEDIPGLRELIEKIVDSRISSLESDTATLADNISRLQQTKADLRHTHRPIDVESLQWYLNRVVITPLDIDDGIVGNEPDW
jgi:hypothetical protein